MGQKQGAPPSPQLPADRAPLWGLNTVSNLPPPPTHCGPLRRGARAALGRRRPGRPDALTAPSAPPPALGSDTGATHCPRFHKAALVPRPQGHRAAPPRGLCPPPQSTLTLEGPRRKPSPLPTPQSPARGAPCRVAEPSFWPQPPCPPLAPTPGADLERPGLSWVEGVPCGRGRAQS